MMQTKYSKRGLGSMTVEQKYRIAQLGGKAAHALGTAHKWTSEEASLAGKKSASIRREISKTRKGI